MRCSPFLGYCLHAISDVAGPTPTSPFETTGLRIWDQGNQLECTLNGFDLSHTDVLLLTEYLESENANK